MAAPRSRRRAPGPAQLPAVDLPALDRHAEPLRGGMTYDAVELRDVDLSGVHSPDAALLECAVTRGRWDDADLRGLRLVECVLAEVGATATGLTGCDWRDVLVRDCRWGVAEAPGATWTSVGVVGGRIDYLNLRGADLTEVVIEGAVLGELDLTGASARRVAIRDTRIGHLLVHEACLDAVDLSGADLGVVDGPRGLRGAKISQAQAHDLAGAFAAELGITLAE